MMLVAWKLGKAFDLDPKTFRFRADLAMNVGILIELLTARAPEYFLLLASIANAIKGVSMSVAGATRASMNRKEGGEGGLM